MFAIAMNWVVACDLISLIGGVVIGVSLMRPRHYTGPFEPRY